jgi:glycosyltransferase involved in cell wall biosynthesis
MINALSARLGGGQTYLINLLRRLPPEAGVEVYIFASTSLRDSLDSFECKWLTSRWPLENPVVRTLWERIVLPRILSRLGIDVLFCPGGIVTTPTKSRCKVVTMFRNMIPFDMTLRARYPHGYMRVRNWLLEREMLRSMLRADLVIFVSQFARRVIEERVPRRIRRAVVIPHGVGPEFRVGNDRAPRPPWLPVGDYLLYVSTFDVYKAQLEVIRGFRLLKNRRQGSEKLVLVGSESQNRSYSQKVRSEIRKLELENDVVIGGLVPYVNLPALYQNALINIFAAESENCPNILLEAMASGRPVLSSCLDPMPEFGGDAAIYFDPRVPSDFVNKVVGIIDDPSALQIMGRRAAERARQYEWEKAAGATWRELLALVEMNPPVQQSCACPDLTDNRVARCEL